jgi:plastocyanin
MPSRVEAVMNHRSVFLCGLLAACLVASCGAAAPPANEAESLDVTEANPTLVPGAVTAPPAGSGPLELTALNIDFEPKALTAPAGPLELRFHNQDNGIPHNVAIKDASGGSVFEPEILTGPADVDYSIPDLAPGSYTFTCTVHPNMTGTLTVVP